MAAPCWELGGYKKNLGKGLDGRGPEMTDERMDRIEDDRRWDTTMLGGTGVSCRVSSMGLQQRLSMGLTPRVLTAYKGEQSPRTKTSGSGSVP